MSETEIVNFKILTPKLLGFTFRQLAEYFGMNLIIQDKRFVALEIHNDFFLIFMNSATNTIFLFDVSNNKEMTKDELFFYLYHFASYNAYINILNKISGKNEYQFEKAYTTEVILSLFYGNFPRSRYSGQFINFNSLTDHQWFKRYITYNESLKQFSLPLFNNESFGVINYVDFLHTSFKFRFKTSFSFFYPESPMDGYKKTMSKEDDLFNRSEVIENNLYISFNPFLLIEISSRLNNNNINYYPILLEPNLNTFKFFHFVNLVNPFRFEKIFLLYSNFKDFYYNDLLNCMLFLIHAANFSQKEYYFEYDYSKNNKLTVIVTQIPESLSFIDVNDMLSELKSSYINEMSGKLSPDFLGANMQGNIDFISDHGFDHRSTKIGNKWFLFLDIPLKVESTLTFSNWMIKKFFENISLRQVNGTDVFTDTP